MRVLHIGKYYSPFSGGIENFMGALLPGLARKGDEVATIVHHHLRGEKYSVENINGVKVYRCPIWGVVLFTPISVSFFFHLNKIIAEFKPDVLHIHMPNVSAFLVFLLRSARAIPIVVHWHSDVVSSSRQKMLSFAYRFYRPLEQALLNMSKAVIVTSPNYLTSSVPLRPWQDKCRVIPLALPTSPPATLEKRGGKRFFLPDEGVLKVLCVGRLTYYKGHAFLIQAAGKLEQVQLVVVGQGDEHDRLQMLVDGQGRGANVTLVGHVDSTELAGLLDDCDCLCLPSIERTEAFGLVLLEAMRAGKPCIVTDVEGSGMSWVVQNSETGIVAKSGDVESLAKALSTLRDNPDLARAMGKAGRTRFDDYYQIEHICEQVSAIYNSLLADE